MTINPKKTQLTPTVHHVGEFAVTLASATRIGGRPINADAVTTTATPLGVGAAVIDGIGSRPETAAATQLAADVAAVVASHRGAQAALLAAAEVMPDYSGSPNAVGAVIALSPSLGLEIAHVGDCAIWAWSRATGLRRWTAAETVGAHIEYMAANADLPDTARTVLERHGGEVAAVLDDYVLNGLVWATINTIAWTPLRGDDADADLLLLTTDGVHKFMLPGQIAELAERHVDNAQALADALVDTATAPNGDPTEDADNATAAVIAVTRTALARDTAAQTTS